MNNNLAQEDGQSLLSAIDHRLKNIPTESAIDWVRPTSIFCG
jgi:hypothetical protein